MKSARLPIYGLIVSLALMVGFACGGSTSTSTSTSHSPQASGSPAASGGPLDPQVSMPANFPSDVPIYPGARLTVGGSYSSGGTTTWGLQWETLDSPDKVSAFYTAKLGEGDWSLTFSGSNNGAFSAIFSRKSNTKVGGILGVDSTGGYTKISLALTNGV